MSFFTDAEKEEFAELYFHRVKIQSQGGGTVNSMGAKNPAAHWADDESFQSLYHPAYGGSGAPVGLRAQISGISNKGNEKSGSGEGPTAISSHQILLLDVTSEHTSRITERQRVIDVATGQIYNIVLADLDPSGSFADLKCKRVGTSG